MANQDYSVRQLLEMEACTNCQVCADVCPAVSASGEGRTVRPLPHEGPPPDPEKPTAACSARLFGQKATVPKKSWKHFSDNVFRCTLCGNCQEICPVGIHLKDLWLSLRQDLVHSGYYPAKINMIRDNLKDSRNVFAEDNEERADWVEDMDDPPADGYIRDKADVVYFTGCVAAYFPLAQNIPMALAEILMVGGVDFTLLGEDEWCCGFPLLGAGLKEMFKEFIQHNLDGGTGKGRQNGRLRLSLLLSDVAGTLPAAEFEIAHASQFLLHLMKRRGSA